MNAQELITQLQLSPHPEGGFFRRTFESPQVSAGRCFMSSIFYLLTEEEPTGHLHRNKSDIVHFWQLGGPLRYTLLSPEGRLFCYTLGPDLQAGEQLQLTVPGGFWKASQLVCEGFGLVSEAVSPGFDYDDHEMARAAHMQKQFPEHWPVLEALCRR